jgi:hypothetical protein
MAREEDGFEPDCHQLFGAPAEVHHVALASIAISLKRIADALNSPNEYGEVGSAAVAGAIVRGVRS